jgi:DNA polymerase-3 subunit epsilon
MKTIHDLAACLELKIGRMFDGGYAPASGPKPRKATELKASDHFDPNVPLHDRVFAFTGTLQSMKREAAMQKVIDGGGKCGDGVSRATNYLVMGDQDYRKFRDGEKSSKLIKAESLVAKGQDLEIIAELDFLRMFPA